MALEWLYDPVSMLLPKCGDNEFSNRTSAFLFLLLFYHFYIYLHVYTLFVPHPPTPPRTSASCGLEPPSWSEN
jgi:hypothetical protein